MNIVIKVIGARFFMGVIMLVGTVNLIHAQKYDYTWLAGYNSFVGYDTLSQHYLGINNFNFKQNPVAIIRDSLGMNFDDSNSAISDSSGNLLFYCNGITVRNFLDDIICDSLSDGYFTDSYDLNVYYWGIPYPQYHLVLPNPINNSLYDIFHLWVDTFDQNDITVKKILRTQLNFTQNLGDGTINYKNRQVTEGAMGWAITAVKHANGKDWWLCDYDVDNNNFNILLYNGSDSIINTTNAYAGDGFTREIWTSMKFSTDGSYFAMAIDSGAFYFYDFDRCSGTLTPKASFFMPEIKDSMWVPWDMEFSPSGRFLYVFCVDRIFQFDMLSNPIEASIDAVGVYAGFDGPFPLDYFGGQLAPDGKIYVYSGDSNYYIGVIDSPDSAGAACKFMDHSIEMPTWMLGLDYFPNYRLGALSGSPCDTLAGLSNAVRASKEQIIKVFPNPATDYVIVDYGFTDWSKGEVYLEITNALGQTVYEQVLPMYSGFQKIDVSNYASGFYVAYIKRQSGLVGAAKFAKQ